MSILKKNILVNYIGQGWVALMGLAFLPLFIKYLGIESYGLIGIFSIMQSCLVLLDLGMSPTINREMARYSAGKNSIQKIWNLLRSLEIICIFIAFFVMSIIYYSADWLAMDWLKVTSLSYSMTSQAITIMAFILGLRFLEGLYRGALFGLQKQVWYNLVYAQIVTIRQVGALVVIVYLSPTISAFFIWQSVISIITVLILGYGVYTGLPRNKIVAKFSKKELLGVKNFAVGMIGITFLSILLTQIDKLLLSKLMPLDVFGYYALATSVSSMIYLVVVPIESAIYPKFVELVSDKNTDKLIIKYHQSCQLVASLTAPIAAMIVVFSKELLLLWSSNLALAENASPILSILTFGVFLNCLMHIPYQLQLAYGYTKLTVQVNLVAIAILIPTIFMLVPKYGAIGAACIWMTLNAGYVLFSIYFIHRKFLISEKYKWYKQDVFIPMLFPSVIFIFAKFLVDFFHMQTILILAIIIISLGLSFALSLWFSVDIRAVVSGIYKSRRI